LPEGEIAPFVSRYGLPTDSPSCHLMGKVHVNGPDAHPVWQFAKKSFPGEVRWNFAAWYLFDKAGQPVGRYEINQLEAVSATLSRLTA